MDHENYRPDPDALLAALAQDSARAHRGRLKVFFGMCPGVGKTYAMLRSARQERDEGVNVLVGIVETHGRKETAALLEGLTVLPRKTIEYRGTRQEEMDLEAILASQPKLVLVDELAHTNVPGSRHAKRWQDVIEILEAGIDVFTTLNVQHLESRADAVRQITGAAVQETLPDSMLELADEVELIDLTPEGLRERLSEGKVYLGERAAAAADHFFQEAHIAALRELALRYTAERVDQQLRHLRAGGPIRTVWRSGERLLVAVGPSPFSVKLVRWTKRMAGALGAPWIAVHVETGVRLPPEQVKRLEKNLELARELGAEVIITHSTDIAEAMVHVALQHNATQIIIGKPPINHAWSFLRGSSLVDRLVRLGGSIDIFVVPGEETTRKKRRFLDRSHLGPVREFGMVAGALGLVTVLGLIVPGLSYSTVGLLYLLAVTILSVFVGRWPILVAAIISALTWDYVFIPPILTFYISKAEDVLLLTIYFVVALISGQQTARIRAQARDERMREERATALLHLTRALSEARTLDEAVQSALRQSEELFDSQAALLLEDEESERLVPHRSSAFGLDDREAGVADWAFRNRRVAGRFTDTLPAATGHHVPLVREDRALGVLVLRPKGDAEFSLRQRDLVQTFAGQLAFMVEREHLRAASERERLLAESDRLHRVLLDSVSHELRTPLAVITAAAENIDTNDEALRASLSQEVRTAARRLNRLVGNLLDQTRLESGALSPRLDWCDVHDLVNAAIDGVGDVLQGRPFERIVPDDLPPVKVDFALTEQALANLLLNAVSHTPPNAEILLTAGIDKARGRVSFTVADRGKGFPASMRERLFKKFARGDAARAGGLGLGLSIVRGFIVAQGGEVVVGENPGGGAVVTLYLPYTPAQHAATTE